VGRVEKRQQLKPREQAAYLSTNNSQKKCAVRRDDYNEDIVDIYQNAHSNALNDSWDKQNGWSGGLLLLAVGDDAAARAAGLAVTRCSLSCCAGAAPWCCCAMKKSSQHKNNAAASRRRSRSAAAQALPL
jgi:hypothetical protein